MSVAADPHPWNTGFTWTAPAGPFRVLTDDQASQFDRDGFVVLPDVFDAATVAEVTAELDRYEAKVDAYLRQLADGRAFIAETGAITFASLLLKRSDLLRRFATSAVLLGICGDLIGDDVRVYWDQAVYKKPEKPRRFPWHQDNGYTFIEPQQYLTCWVAMTDATTDNGCPWVVPGLHRLGTLRHHYVEPLGWECLEDPDGAVAAPVGAGGTVVFSSLTPHLTGPNTTGEVRKAYILQYAATGARTQLGESGAGPPTGETPCDDPEHQFPVLAGGQPVAPPTVARR